jgi:hypothetical protein
MNLSVPEDTLSDGLVKKAYSQLKNDEKVESEPCECSVEELLKKTVPVTEVKIPDNGSLYGEIENMKLSGDIVFLDIDSGEGKDYIL